MGGLWHCFNHITFKKPSVNGEPSLDLFDYLSAHSLAGLALQRWESRRICVKLLDSVTTLEMEQRFPLRNFGGKDSTVLEVS